jgi:uncharacterized membrane protein
MSEKPFEDQGRIGIQVTETAYTISPGGNTSISLVLRNQGLEDESFALSVEGVPGSWVSSSLPVVELTPGEEKETELSLQAPSPTHD